MYQFFWLTFQNWGARYNSQNDIPLKNEASELKQREGHLTTRNCGEIEHGILYFNSAGHYNILSLFFMF
jgi:hypothetical protein